MKTLKDELRVARTLLDASQRAVGAEIGVSGQTIGYWERGVIIPGEEYWSDIKRVLNVDVSSFPEIYKDKKKNISFTATDNANIHSAGKNMTVNHGQRNDDMVLEDLEKVLINTIRGTENPMLEITNILRSFAQRKNV